MSYYVYILKSASSGRHYCGQTSNLERRVRQHNDPDYTFTKTTKRFEGPWELIWHRRCGTRAEAMKIEKEIKKRGIARFLTDQTEE